MRIGIEVLLVALGRYRWRAYLSVELSLVIFVADVTCCSW